MKGFVDEMSIIPEAIAVKEAAFKIGVSEQYVRELLRSGQLAGRFLGRQWIVSSVAINDYLSRSSFPISDQDSHFNKRCPMPKIKALSFFSGAMGLDLGLERAGISCILACEIDKSCRETIKKNRPDIALLGDISNYSGADIRKAAGLNEKDEIDLMVGGPPCQTFSTAGTRKGFEDKRGNALLTYLDLILDLKPRYAVIENVRGLLSAPLSHRPHAKREKGSSPLSVEELPGGALLHVLAILRKAGYGVSFNLYNSANFGSPQIRERVVIICHRDGDKVPHLTPTHSQNGDFGLPKWRTFRDAVVGLEKIKHTHVDFPEARLRYYRLLGPGQYWKNLPPKLQEEALGKSFFSGGGKTGFFRRLAWDKPAPTLVTYPAMPATDLAHPEELRPLSVEEYKRIQEFPDDWGFCGSTKDIYRQIGNAVPASVGEAIGKSILDHMSGQKENSFIGFPYSRYKNTDEISWENQVRNLLIETEESLDDCQNSFTFASA